MDKARPKIAFYARALASSHGLANALAECGCDVVEVDATDPARASMQVAFAAAGMSGIDCAIAAVAPTERGPTRPLLDWSMKDWRRCADEAQLHLLQVLQGLRDALDGRSCTIVLIGPTLGMTGAANHVALATATEGQRGLMKSLARQWAPQLRFAWLSVWTPLMFPEILEAALPEQCELGDYAAPLGRPGWDVVARAAMILGSSDAAGMTGQTLIIDGGEWMLS